MASNGYPLRLFAQLLEEEERENFDCSEYRCAGNQHHERRIQSPINVIAIFPFEKPIESLKEWCHCPPHDARQKSYDENHLPKNHMLFSTCDSGRSKRAAQERCR